METKITIMGGVISIDIIPPFIYKVMICQN